MVNGGRYITPTFLKRGKSEADKIARRVVSRKTSEQIRKLLRLNVTTDYGTAKRAEVAAYQVGGKTGTANKSEAGSYSKDKVLTSFAAIFPAHRPEYVVFVMLDEPKAVPHTRGLHVAGVNVAPVTKAIIERLAPLLKVKPHQQGVVSLEASLVL